MGSTAAAVFMGVPVDDVTMPEAVERIFELVADGRASRRVHQVVTVNVDFVVNGCRDPALADVMRDTSLSIPDGMPIVWGSGLLGSRLRTRVAGADLVAHVTERSVAFGATIVLYGAAPGVAQRAAEKLSAAYPGAAVIGESGPMFRELDDVSHEDISRLRVLGADVCFVGFGNPKQERFIARFGKELGIPVMIGIGGSLDFLVGEQRRAPRWMQRSGLEWVHRAAMEPRRLGGRYIRDAAVFLPALVRQAWCGRRWRAQGTPAFRWNAERLEIDLVDLGIADNAAIARIVSEIRAARRTGTPIVVHGLREAQFDWMPGLSGWLARLPSDEDADQSR